MVNFRTFDHFYSFSILFQCVFPPSLLEKCFQLEIRMSLIDHLMGNSKLRIYRFIIQHHLVLTNRPLSSSSSLDLLFFAKLFRQECLNHKNSFIFGDWIMDDKISSSSKRSCEKSHKLRCSGSSDEVVTELGFLCDNIHFTFKTFCIPACTVF